MISIFWLHLFQLCFLSIEWNSRLPLKRTRNKLDNGKQNFYHFFCHLILMFRHISFPSPFLSILCYWPFCVLLLYLSFLSASTKWLKIIFLTFSAFPNVCLC
jgi:hypothetical protein